MGIHAKMGLKGAGDVTNVSCLMAVSPAQFSVHAYGHLQDRRAYWPAPFKRPSIGMCCKRADWANFMSTWERYRVGSNILPGSALYKFIECL